MRIGIVRDDLPKGIYIDDIENTSQRNFSSQQKGQSRYLKKPTDAEITAFLTEDAVVPVSTTGTDTAATVDTSSNDTLRIRRGASDAYVVVTVTSGATTAKTVIANDLNLAFLNQGLPFVASVGASNELIIKSKAPNTGPSGRLQIDTVANGSTLSTAVGFNVAGVIVSGVTTAAFKAVVYPTSTNIDVGTASLTALFSTSELEVPELEILIEQTQDFIAPRFVETGMVLRSFSSGVISQLSSPDFQPGGDRGNLTAGTAAAVLADDGVTIFTL